MTQALLPHTRAAMDLITAEVAEETNTPIELIRRHGKLTKALMKVRRTAIRRMHATGLYRRTEIALYFGLSIYTITSSLEDAMKDRPKPFTDAEDRMVVKMYCAGHNAEMIASALDNRSVSSVRRRLAVLRKSGEHFRPFPRPSYKGGVPAMIAMAKKENALMLRNL